MNGAAYPADLSGRTAECLEWERGLASLVPNHAPCQGFRNWAGVYDVARKFVAEHGDAAVGLGWTTLELFGVHKKVGTIRADCTGALMVTNGRKVLSVSRDTIPFEGGMTFYRAALPGGDLVVPIWQFGKDA